MENPSTPLVEFTDTGITANINSIAEAKQAIQELKLKKKEFTLAKKEIALQQQQLRAEYTNEVRTRGSMITGGGTLGKIARSMQTLERDKKRADLANNLAPLEEKKIKIEGIIWN